MVGLVDFANKVLSVTSPLTQAHDLINRLNGEVKESNDACSTSSSDISDSVMLPDPAAQEPGHRARPAPSSLGTKQTSPTPSPAHSQEAPITAKGRAVSSIAPSSVGSGSANTLGGVPKESLNTPQPELSLNPDIAVPTPQAQPSGNSVGPDTQAVPSDSNVDLASVAAVVAGGKGGSMLSMSNKDEARPQNPEAVKPDVQLKGLDI
jgi:hypothetical protein